LSAVCDCLFNIFAATVHTWRTSLHPQPDDAPCHGDKDPPNMEAEVLYTAIMAVVYTT